MTTQLLPKLLYKHFARGWTRREGLRHTLKQHMLKHLGTGKMFCFMFSQGSIHAKEVKPTQGFTFMQVLRIATIKLGTGNPSPDSRVGSRRLEFSLLSLSPKLSAEWATDTTTQAVPRFSTWVYSHVSTAGLSPGLTACIFRNSRQNYFKQSYNQTGAHDDVSATDQPERVTVFLPHLSKDVALELTVVIPATWPRRGTSLRPGPCCGWSPGLLGCCRLPGAHVLWLPKL